MTKVCDFAVQIKGQKLRELLADTNFTNFILYSFIN